MVRRKTKRPGDPKFSSQRKTTTLPADSQAGSSSADDELVLADVQPPMIKAVQLAPDVRLPAASIPDHSGNVSPEVAATLQGMVDRFYRDLQSLANKAELENPGAAGGLEFPDEETALITNSAETDHALDHADEMFRAMFGQETFLERTLFSGTEVLLDAPAGLGK